MRDKLFFFWSEEFLQRTYPTSVSFQTFPTALERLGNFSRSLDQNGQLIVVKDPLTELRFRATWFPPTGSTLAARTLLSLFPLPNATDPTRTYNYVTQDTIRQPRNDQVLRIDWNLSPSTSFYARGILDRENKQGGFGYVLASPAWSQLPLDYKISSEGVVGTLLHTFGPKSVNEVTLGPTAAMPMPVR